MEFLAEPIGCPLLHSVQFGSGHQPASRKRCDGILSVRAKWKGCLADNRPPSAAEVTNTRYHYSTPPYVFLASCLIKGTEKLTLGHVLSLIYRFLQPEARPNPDVSFLPLSRTFRFNNLFSQP